MKLIRGLDRLVEFACAALLVLFTGLVLYSVTMRYAFSAPPMWGEDIPKLLFVWMSFIGGGICYLRNQNIRMTSLIDRAPRGPRRLVEVLMYLGILVMLACIIWYSQPVLRLASRNTVYSTGLSDIWTYLALPIASVLFFAHSVLRIVHILRGGVDEDPLARSEPH